jgi:hypothetical protein
LDQSLKPKQEDSSSANECSYLLILNWLENNDTSNNNDPTFLAHSIATSVSPCITMASTAG